jgi:hypothetical protein
MANVTPDMANLMSVMAPSDYGSSPAIQNFNDSLIEMLKRQQSLGTLGLQQRQSQYETEQANTILAATPEAERTFSPSQQGQIRTAQAQTYAPSIEGVQGRAKTFSEQIAGLGQMLQMARQMSDDIENRRMQKEQFSQQMALERAKLAQSGASSNRANYQTVVGADGNLYSFDPETGKMGGMLNEAPKEQTMEDVIRSLKEQGAGIKDVQEYFTSQKMSPPTQMINSIYGKKAAWTLPWGLGSIG